MTGHENVRVFDYIEHIAQAIERIQEYVAGMDEPAFLADHRTQDATIRNLEIIGEACNNVTGKFPAYADGHPEVPWRFAYEMRNVVAHGYFKVDLSVVWRTIHGDLPVLGEQVRVLLASR